MWCGYALTLYLYNGVVRKFFPDYLIPLQNGKTLILEVKGQDSGFRAKQG
jgi:type III restriction enzyme